MTALYTIVGALVVFSLGLYVLLGLLKSKQAQQKQKRKLEAIQAVTESRSEKSRQFIPSGGSAE